MQCRRRKLNYTLEKKAARKKLYKKLTAKKFHLTGHVSMPVSMTGSGQIFIFSADSIYIIPIHGLV